MINAEFKVHVNQKPGWDLWEIFLVSRIGNDVYNHNVDKNGNLIAKKIIAGVSATEPLLRISGSLWGDIVKAISSDLPNVERDVIDADLKATKYHLEDMRKLVFEGKK